MFYPLSLHTSCPMHVIPHYMPFPLSHPVACFLCCQHEQDHAEFSCHWATALLRTQGEGHAQVWYAATVAFLVLFCHSILCLLHVSLQYNFRFVASLIHLLYMRSSLTPFIVSLVQLLSVCSSLTLFIASLIYLLSVLFSDSIYRLPTFWSFLFWCTLPLPKDGSLSSFTLHSLFLNHSPVDANTRITCAYSSVIGSL